MKAMVSYSNKNIACDKSFMLGTPITIGELLKALKGSVFKNFPDDSPIRISTMYEPEPLTLIFIRNDSDHILRFESGHNIESEKLSSEDMVFFDVSNNEADYISKSDLIGLLEDCELPHDTYISICSSKETTHVALTMCLKCHSPECKTIHLTNSIAYEFIPN